jgi:UDP:flavonoid glycosyltransferase YjiC (YdhE family)
VARVLNPAAWPEQLFAAVDSALRDVPAVRRVTECASTLRAENGPARAVAELEKLFA